MNTLYEDGAIDRDRIWAGGADTGHPLAHFIFKQFKLADVQITTASTLLCTSVPAIRWAIGSSWPERAHAIHDAIQGLRLSPRYREYDAHLFAQQCTLYARG